jgi:hypothetical protein
MCILKGFPTALEVVSLRRKPDSLLSANCERELRAKGDEPPANVRRIQVSTFGREIT